MVDNPKPLVSIITPAYNRADLIEETILSVLNQDYPYIEYIVLDDGSTDKTLEVIKRYKSKLIFRTHKNMGETRTVNKGFSIAKGEIVCVISSDDPLLPKAVSTAVEFLNKNKDIIVAYPDWNMIDENAKKIDHIKTFHYSYTNMLRWHHCFPGPGAFIRKSVIRTLEGRDTQFKYVGDFDFWLRAGLIGNFARIPKTLATFRVHSNSASVSAKGKAMAAEHIKLVNKIYSLPNLPKEIKKIKKEAYSSAHYIAGVVAGEGLPSLRIKHYLLAFLQKPSKYLGEYRNRTKIFILEILNQPLKIKDALIRGRKSVCE
ncbi:hypothetical protein COT77_02255 [Candidatus Berkelbacteria bacterium CG10_big_fil_rev_8_21_14_0_10_41_12]|uniref:Glycosyltransferase 2-like domain-containing protein n=1 Tax=Candidatus Berkelbacteria bacterium CG10_big_fil_rev_8_21_14_0_10_41_12 TaxID=1974513 RepID=A0A2M6WX10_9BACT|nr:MAG: hypothetical protein COT77_02255 [Candidatus Berkelbacteria bacterium CG10_big_fil_rev_8_21_14_0_10_41_12]